MRGQGVEFSSEATTTEWGTSATVRLSLQDEVVEAPGVLHIVATKVLGELEAGVVFVAPVNGAGQSQRLVAIATRAQDFDHLKVGSWLDWEPEKTDSNSIQDLGRHDVVAELGELAPLLHGESDKIGTVGSPVELDFDKIAGASSGCGASRKMGRRLFE